MNLLPTHNNNQKKGKVWWILLYHSPVNQLYANLNAWLQVQSLFDCMHYEIRKQIPKFWCYYAEMSAIESCRLWQGKQVSLSRPVSAKKPWACHVCVRLRKIDWDLLFICHSSSACLYASVDSLIIVSQTHTQTHWGRSWRSNAFWCHLVWQTHTHWHQCLKQAQCVRQICPPCHIHPVPAAIWASRNFYITHSSIRPPATKFTVASGVQGD